MSYVLMKAFEQMPGRFDLWMGILSLGRLAEIRQDIVDAVPPGRRVLDVGCGTGTLSISLATRGVHVTGIDMSEDMLAVGRERASTAPLAGRLDLKRLSSLEIEDAFAAGSFDGVVSMLLLSELSDAEVDCTLTQCRGVLERDGTLIVVDEIETENAVRRTLHHVLSYPPRLLAYLALQARDLKSSGLAKKVLYFAIEFPLMLLTFVVVPAPSRPLRDLPARLARAGFLVTSRRRVGRSLSIIQAVAQ